jgi:hypothetical protein
MARPRNMVGDKRDGFLNFRIPPELADDLVVLSFLLGVGTTGLCVRAMQEMVTKHKEAIDKVKAVWYEVRPQQNTTDQESES